MNKRIPWNKSELLIVFDLYCRTPFGKLHQRNPEIIKLAALLNRTPAAVAMKACNFASLDPIHQNRGKAALKNASRADKKLFDNFLSNPESVILDAYDAIRHLNIGSLESPEIAPNLPAGPTESLQTIKARRVQSFFRKSVLVSYNNQCAISGLAIPDLLTASHIVPWKADISLRADPRNGIALNALYDRAFDRGYISIDDDYRIITSPKLRKTEMSPFLKTNLVDIEGTRLRLPYRFMPSKEAIEYHRKHIFKSSR